MIFIQRNNTIYGNDTFYFIKHYNRNDMGWIKGKSGPTYSGIHNSTFDKWYRNFKLELIK